MRATLGASTPKSIWWTADKLLSCQTLMLIAIYIPDYIPESFRVYTDNLVRELGNLGCQAIRFRAVTQIPTKAQLLWDPRAGGGNPRYC